MIKERQMSFNLKVSCRTCFGISSGLVYFRLYLRNAEIEDPDPETSSG